MSNNIFSDSDVLSKFQSTLDDQDSEIWDKLPMSDKEKHDFLMEQSKDPRVQALYIKIKELREHISEAEKKLVSKYLEKPQKSGSLECPQPPSKAVDAAGS